MSPKKFVEKFWRRPDIPSKCKWALLKGGGGDAVNAVEPDPHRHVPPPPGKARVIPNALHFIGNTPLVRINRISKDEGLKCELYAKCEFLNVGGSVKDRIGMRMVEEAERDGVLKPGSTVIEPTSGNTGVGLALACAVKGYRCIISMPEKMSREKVDILRALGAEIIRTPTAAAFDSPESHFRVAARLQQEIKNAVILNQYTNPYNPITHYDSTAEEILQALDGQVDLFVAGAGTGGTLTGVGRKLKEKCEKVKIVGVDPMGSIMAQPDSINQNIGCYIEMEGIGSDFVPTCLDQGVVDEWRKSEDKSSFLMSRRLIRDEGLLCGGSCGAAMSQAVEVARELKEGQKCVVILPDSVRNYMTKFLADDWMVTRRFLEADVPDHVTDQWWWNLQVSSLDISSPNTVHAEDTCGVAFELMEREGFHQVPVTGPSGDILGIVTLGNMMASFATNKVSMDDPISKVAYATGTQVRLKATLGMLSHILDTDHFVTVVDDPDPENRCGPRNILGLVTRFDLLNFIREHEDGNDNNENNNWNED